MTVEQLIIELKKMPNQKARVYHLWDGEPRTEINYIYHSRSGDVVTSDFSENCYSIENTPENADIIGLCWKTPKE